MFIVIIVPTQSSIFLRWYCNIACVVNYLNCNQSSNPPLNAINRFAKTQFVNYWRELILMLTRSHTRNDWKYSIPFDQRNLWYEHVWNRRRYFVIFTIFSYPFIDQPNIWGSNVTMIKYLPCCPRDYSC